MSGIAIVVYLLAIGIPVHLLHHFHTQAWYWHALALAAALGIGLIPPLPGWQGAGADLVCGFSCVFLLIWGLGGLVLGLGHAHREKHA
jgi:hypothetical protein